MRKLFLIFIFIMFSFNANAIKVGQLYKWCKPYQANGFQIKELLGKQRYGALSCLMFLRATVYAGWNTCVLLREKKQK